MRKIGHSQYFLRVRRNIHSSLIIAIAHLLPVHIRNTPAHHHLPSRHAPCRRASRPSVTDTIAMSEAHSIRQQTFCPTCEIRNQRPPHPRVRLHDAKERKGRPHVATRDGQDGSRNSRRRVLHVAHLSRRDL